MPVHGRHSKTYKFGISVDQPSEVAYWTRTLKATEPELRAAIQEVGSHALNVREYLDRQRANPLGGHAH